MHLHNLNMVKNKLYNQVSLSNMCQDMLCKYSQQKMSKQSNQQDILSIHLIPSNSQLRMQYKQNYQSIHHSQQDMSNIFLHLMLIHWHIENILEIHHILSNQQDNLDTTLRQVIEHKLNIDIFLLVLQVLHKFSSQHSRQPVGHTIQVNKLAL